MARAKGELGEIGPSESVTNGAAAGLALRRPYVAQVEITGTTDCIYHRYDIQSVEEKDNSPKGSLSKKTDNLESYVYRDEKGNLVIPGKWVQAAVAEAAKYKQDPRSRRKSLYDLAKAAISVLNDSSLGRKEWDYNHREPVMVQRNRVLRTRPAIKAGYKATFSILIRLPHYIPESLLHSVLVDAGQLQGIGDHRPSFGQFRVTSFQVLSEPS